MSGGRRIPIIGDDYVDREFGTGALKVTPGALAGLAFGIFCVGLELEAWGGVVGGDGVREVRGAGMPPVRPVRLCGAGRMFDLETCPLPLPTRAGHDPNDWEMGKRRNLEVINIMNKDASMNERAGEWWRARFSMLTRLAGIRAIATKNMSK